MSLKDENALKPEELIFLLAIAGRIDAQSKLIAKKLDGNQGDGAIYQAYAILDSLNSSYSMFKYFIEVYFSGSNPDLIHKILTSPAGIAAVILEASFLVSFSLLASIFNLDKNNNNGKDTVKKFIADAWPYFRDVVLKALKNAYKGWRSTVQILSLIGGTDLKHMIVPVGLVLGILAGANRLWLRYVQEKRKKMMSENGTLLEGIQTLTPTRLDCERNLRQISSQKMSERIHALFASGVAGVIDGLYLHVGVVTLAILSPSLLLTLSVVSAFYALICIVTRIYEEYDYQLRLIITQTWCQFAIATNEVKIAYAKLFALQEKTDKSPDEIKLLESEFYDSIKKFEELRQLLKRQVTHNYFTAGLLGIKYGLYAYGVLTSFLFMTASVFLITATVFPPALLAAFIVSGLVLMAGMMAFTLSTHYLHMQRQKKDTYDEEHHPYAQLKKMTQGIENNNNVAILSPERFRESLQDGVTIVSSPQFFFQEWFEIFRSMASGLSKGNSFFSFLAIPFQSARADEHEPSVMSILGWGSAILFSLVLSLRALARGFGRDPKVYSINVTEKPPVAEKPPVDEKETKPDRDSSDPDKKKQRHSLPRRASYSSPNLHFFPPIPAHPHSTTALDCHSKISTTLGLE